MVARDEWPSGALANIRSNSFASGVWPCCLAVSAPPIVALAEIGWAGTGLYNTPLGRPGPGEPFGPMPLPPPTIGEILVPACGVAEGS